MVELWRTRVGERLNWGLNESFVTQRPNSCEGVFQSYIDDL